MKKMLLINVSPRTKGTSFTMLQMCKKYLEGRGYQTELFHLYQNLTHMNKLITAAADADTIIISGPCYINTYPADTIALLKELLTYKEMLQGKSLYGIIQGGMPYAHTHESGLSLLDIFCKKCGMFFKGGFVMGMGAYLDGKPLTKLPNGKKVIRQLNIFFQHMEKDEISPPEVYRKAQFKLPGIFFKVMVKKMNQNIDRDLQSHGIDVNQRNPYLTSYFADKQREEAVPLSKQTFL
ncbi:MAG: NAD(P)H-dependent oxidoreductase [Mobilitalea sp.]